MKIVDTEEKTVTYIECKVQLAYFAAGNYVIYRRYTADQWCLVDYANGESDALRGIAKELEAAYQAQRDPTP